jgi:hypothetical protein
MIIDTFNTQFVATSGSGVIGITGKPFYMGGIFNGASSGQGVQLYGASGGAAVTMAVMTIAANTYLQFPAAFASGMTYQTFSNPGDAVLRLTFFWLPGTTT